MTRILRFAILGAALAIARQAVVADATAQTASIWDGVYTEPQARRGEVVYTGPCSKCHGYKLDGAPEDPDMPSTRPVAGPKFLREWDGRALAALFEYTRTTMPENNPSYLTDQEYADLVAYMLFVSGVPAGRSELRADRLHLDDLLIRQQP